MEAAKSMFEKSSLDVATSVTVEIAGINRYFHIHGRRPINGTEWEMWLQTDGNTMNIPYLKEALKQMENARADLYFRDSHKIEI
jgi:hypothetical protein